MVVNFDELNSVGAIIIVEYVIAKSNYDIYLPKKENGPQEGHFTIKTCYTI